MPGQAGFGTRASFAIKSRSWAGSGSWESYPLRVQRLLDILKSRPKTWLRDNRGLTPEEGKAAPGSRARRAPVRNRTLCRAAGVGVSKRDPPQNPDSQTKATGGFTPIAASGDLLWIAAMGGLGGSGVLCLIASFRMTEVSNLAPFNYFGILFAFVLGWVFFGEAPVERLFPIPFLKKR